MTQPGISRAVSLGFVGFLFGALLVIVVRALQSLTPVWDVGVGLVFCTIFTAVFFIWGIGAFDPRMSVHGEGDHDDDDIDQAHGSAEAAAAHGHAAEPVTAFGVLSSSIWQITLGTIVLILALFAMAWTGPALIITDENGASVRAIGMVPMALFGQELIVSHLTLFAMFVAFTILSLAIAGWLIYAAVNFLSTGIVEAAAEAKAGGRAGAALPARRAAPALAATSGEGSERAIETQPAPAGAVSPLVVALVFAVVAVVIGYLVSEFVLTPLLGGPADLIFVVAGAIGVGFALAALPNVLPLNATLRAVATGLIIALVLYPVFFYALLGLALPGIVPGIREARWFGQEPLVWISIAHVVVIAILLVRPSILARLIGRFARWLAHFLRSLLGGKIEAGTRKVRRY